MIPFADNRYKSKVFEGLFQDGEIIPPYRMINGRSAPNEGSMEFHMPGKDKLKFKIDFTKKVDDNEYKFMKAVR